MSPGAVSPAPSTANGPRLSARASAASAAPISPAIGMSRRISTAPAATATPGPNAGSATASAFATACAVSSATPPTGSASAKSEPLRRPSRQPGTRSV